MEVCSSTDVMAVEDILCYRRGKFRLKMPISSNTVMMYLLDEV